MHPDSKNYTFNYVPGRTVEELEEERLISVLKLPYSERFARMMALIRLTKKIKYPQPLTNPGDGYTGR